MRSAHKVAPAIMPPEAVPAPASSGFSSSKFSVESLVLGRAGSIGRAARFIATTRRCKTVGVSLAADPTPTASRTTLSPLLLLKTRVGTGSF